MKAITLWQPWASLVAEKVKLIETRPKQHPWRSAIGQTIAIHAAKREPEHAFIGDWEVGRLDPGAPRRLWNTTQHDRPLDLPLGAVVATCTLVDVVPIRDAPNYGWQMDDGRFWNLDPQRPFGDFTPGRWALLLDNIVKCAPFPVRGYQGLWTVPEHVADNLVGWAA